MKNKQFKSAELAISAFKKSLENTMEDLQKTFIELSDKFILNPRSTLANHGDELFTVSASMVIYKNLYSDMVNNVNIYSVIEDWKDNLNNKFRTMNASSSPCHNMINLESLKITGKLVERLDYLKAELELHK